MLIAQLSDPHIVAGTPTAEPVLGLQQALRRALSLDPGPDCILITGDLVEHGRPEEYELLREVLDPIPVPVYVMTGNHDDRDPLLDAFAGPATSTGPTGPRTRSRPPTRPSWRWTRSTRAVSAAGSAKNS